jgi:hypothetical protein
MKKMGKFFSLKFDFNYITWEQKEREKEKKKATQSFEKINIKNTSINY